nr:hypothetical protein [uncultured Brumimicrobium sp.]
MATNDIQSVKLSIINKITNIEDKSLLKRVWEIIQSNEDTKQTSRAFSKEEKEILNSIRKGIEEIKLIEKGKLKATSLNDFLDEL